MAKARTAAAPPTTTPLTVPTAAQAALDEANTLREAAKIMSRRRTQRDVMKVREAEDPILATIQMMCDRAADLDPVYEFGVFRNGDLRAKVAITPDMVIALESDARIGEAFAALMDALR